MSINSRIIDEDVIYGVIWWNITQPSKNNVRNMYGAGDSSWNWSKLDEDKC